MQVERLLLWAKILWLLCKLQAENASRRLQKACQYLENKNVFMYLLIGKGQSAQKLPKKTSDAYLRQTWSLYVVC